MTWHDESGENVRVFRGAEAPEYADHQQQRQRSEAQKHMDTAIDHAEELATQALDNVTEALEWLSVVCPPKNATAPVYIRQLVEEIAELRRVRQ